MSQHSSRGPAWEALRKVVIEEEPICHWCGLAASTDADHLIAKAMGGTDERHNLVGSCGPCNRKRGARPALVRVTYLSPRWFDSKSTPVSLRGAS